MNVAHGVTYACGMMRVIMYGWTSASEWWRIWHQNLPETLQLFQTTWCPKWIFVIMHGDECLWGTRRVTMMYVKAVQDPGEHSPFPLNPWFKWRSMWSHFVDSAINCDARWHTFPRDDESNDVCELVQMSCKKAIAPRIFLNPYRSDVQATGCMHPWLWCTVTQILERQGQWCM